MYPDYSALAPTRADVQVFSGAGQHTWLKPRADQMTLMLCVGSGSGGGGGFSAAPGNARGGGAGGGSGGVAFIVIPTLFLPDALYVTVAAGGAGGGAGVAGSVGGSSTIYVSPQTGTAQNLLLISGNTNHGVPAAGAASGSATAGTGETANSWASNNQCLSAAMCLGFPSNSLVTSTYGSGSGTVGGVATGGAGGALGNSSSCAIVTGGTGGGGVGTGNSDNAGGAITGTNEAFVGVTAAAAATNGPGGLINAIWGRMAFTGGLGGGSNSAGTGGVGGQGAAGSGGGGGGGGTTGGAGGRGGDGLVIFWSW